MHDDIYWACFYLLCLMLLAVDEQTAYGRLTSPHKLYGAAEDSVMTKRCFWCIVKSQAMLTIIIDLFTFKKLFIIWKKNMKMFLFLSPGKVPPKIG